MYLPSSPQQAAPGPEEAPAEEAVQSGEESEFEDLLSCALSSNS